MPVSALFVTGGLSSSMFTAGISLVASATVSCLVQIYMKHKNFDIKIYQCHYAYQRYTQKWGI